MNFFLKACRNFKPLTWTKVNRKVTSTICWICESQQKVKHHNRKPTFRHFNPYMDQRRKPVAGYLWESCCWRSARVKWLVERKTLSEGRFPPEKVIPLPASTRKAASGFRKVAYLQNEMCRASLNIFDDVPEMIVLSENNAAFLYNQCQLTPTDIRNLIMDILAMMIKVSRII